METSNESILNNAQVLIECIPELNTLQLLYYEDMVDLFIAPLLCLGNCIYAATSVEHHQGARVGGNRIWSSFVQRCDSFEDGI
jgi:hypothetical protein